VTEGRTSAGAGETPVDVLARWEASGAVWRVAARTETRVVVDLLTCDEMEVVGSVVGTPAELDAYLGGRDDSLSGSED
jgi:hypothetical protein